MKVEENDQQCFNIYKGLGEAHLQLENIAKALNYFEISIGVKEIIIKNLMNRAVEAKPHYIDIARIYEILAEVYFDQGKTDLALELANNVISNYLEFKFELFMCIIVNIFETTKISLPTLKMNFSKWINKHTS